MNQIDQSAFGLLSHLNTEELKELLNYDNKFDVILKDVQQVKMWETEKEMVIASNRSLAEFNLSKEPEIKSAKDEIAKISQRGEQICQRISSKLEQYKNKSSGRSADTTLALLQTAAAQSEEASEKIATDFLNGQLDVETFLNKFIAERKTMHLRKIKAEKMAELLGGIGTNGMFNGRSSMYPTVPAPYPTVPYQAPYPSIPYPTGVINMPMPGAYSNHF